MIIYLNCTCAHSGEWHDQGGACDFTGCECQREEIVILAPECPHDAHASADAVTVCITCGATRKAGGAWADLPFVAGLRQEIVQLRAREALR